MTRALTDRDFQRLIRDKGGRLTRPRVRILRILRHEGHLDVEAIHQRLCEEDPSANLSTVYRTVALLKEMGLVRESHLEEEHHHYELADRRDHGHLVCNVCGRVEELRPQDLTALRASVEARGFCADPLLVELPGVCVACAAEAGGGDEKESQAGGGELAHARS